MHCTNTERHNYTFLPKTR